MRKRNSLFNYKKFHEELCKSIANKDTKCKRIYFKAADSFIKLIGEKQIEKYSFSFYHSNSKYICNEITVYIHIKDKPYILICKYLFRKPALIIIQVIHNREGIASIDGRLNDVRKHFRRVFNDIKKKIENNEKPQENTGVFYYFIHHDYCVLANGKKFFNLF